MRNALIKVEELRKIISSLPGDEIDFLSDLMHDVFREMTHFRHRHEHPNSVGEIIPNCLRRSLRWWLEVGNDRHYSQKNIKQFENAFDILAKLDFSKQEHGLPGALNKISVILRTVSSLPEDEIEFLSSYLSDRAHSMRHHSGGKPDELNLLALWDQFGPGSYAQFIYKLLVWTYENDEYRTVSEVCGCLFGSLPETDEIRQILLKGIWDTTKSNRLRERFFWCFGHHFKNAAVNFFSKELGIFLQQNENNEDLLSDIINQMHWSIDEKEGLETLKQVAHDYISAQWHDSKT